MKGFKEPLAMGIKVIPYRLADSTFLIEKSSKYTIELKQQFR